MEEDTAIPNERPPAGAAGSAADELAVVKVTVDSDLSKASSGSEVLTNVLVSVQPPQQGHRQPCDITCVIDTSGSMGQEAKIQSAGGTSESHGLSLLDVAKHGVKTIIKMLTARDRLSMVRFSHESQVVLELTAMDEKGQDLAFAKLEEMRANGGTDIWQGLQSGMETLRTGAEAGRFGHVMLLTDGESRHAQNILPNMKKYKEQHERLPGTVNTFAFGYKLDSRLLANMAVEGSGTYSFIPDAGFVGTAFVNSLGNLLVTMAREAYVVLEVDSGAEIVVDKSPEDPESLSISGFPVAKKSEFYRVNIGTLQYGQSKDIVFPMRIRDSSDTFLVANVQYETLSGGAGNLANSAPAEAKAAEMTGVSMNAELVARHHCRTLFANAIFKAVLTGTAANSQGRQAEAKDIIAQAVDMVQKSAASADEQVKALLEDMCGQSTEAVSCEEYWAKWGIHYLPSIMFAHKLQQRNNFKDPGVQVYGGKLFEDLRDEADDVFNELPPPKPSAPRRPSSSGMAMAAPVSMAAYNDCSAG